MSNSGIPTWVGLPYLPGHVTSVATLAFLGLDLALFTVGELVV